MSDYTDLKPNALLFRFVFENFADCKPKSAQKIMKAILSEAKRNIEIRPYGRLSAKLELQEGSVTNKNILTIEFVRYADIGPNMERIPRELDQIKREIEYTFFSLPHMRDTCSQKVDPYTFLVV